VAVRFHEDLTSIDLATFREGITRNPNNSYTRSEKFIKTIAGIQSNVFAAYIKTFN